MNTETIISTANQAKRTFTIRKYVNGKVFSKYKTQPMSREEFNNCEYNMEKDWKDYLKSNEYQLIK